MALITAGLAARPAAQSAPLLPAVELGVYQDMTGDVWPADMNRDGKTDLVHGSSGGVAVSLGNGDWSFAPAAASGVAGSVLTVGDVNGDRYPDVVVHAGEELVILPGTGTALLGAPQPVLGGGGFTFASVADMDDDGVRDLVVGQEASSLHVLPGNGDFTFDPPFSFDTAAWPHGHIVADLDADGRADIVVAHRYEHSLKVFRNGGSFALTPTELPIEHSSTDVTARDLNGDGRVDLVVSARGGADDGPYTQGLVYVYRGNGDGTFAAPATFETARGTQSVVVGDFTRDGVTDIATTNRSWVEWDLRCGPDHHGVDSATILEGRGDGTFAPAVHFALGPDVANPEFSQFRELVGTLNTADINRDGHSDLIASHGRILFNVPPRENRAPQAYAGDDQWVGPGEDGYAVLYGGGTDPDFHLLSFDWGSAAPGPPPHVALACATLPEGPGTSVFTITADDGHGGTSSASVRVTQEEAPGQALPAGWTAGDVGGVGAEGSASVDESGRLSIRGSGADVWGTADEFTWVHQPVSGDFEASVKVWSVQHVDVWTKAGLMVRDGDGAGARHASIFVTPSTTKGIAFQRRPTTGGASVHTPGPAATAPHWIRLRRTGNVVSAYTSSTGSRDQWTLVGRQTFATLSDTIEIGLAVSSHRDGVLAEALFDQPLILAPSSVSWVTQDIGDVGRPGTGTYTNFPTELTIEGSGADIWGTADAFRFHNQSWTLDGTVTTRVRSIERTHDWAKAGVMFRETLAPGARHVMLIVSPGKGLAMQYRASPGGGSANVALAPGVAAPEWVRLTRAGNTFTGYASEDGTTWRTIGSITIAMSGDAYAGLAVTSHDNTQLATAAFEQLQLGR